MLSFSALFITNLANHKIPHVVNGEFPIKKIPNKASKIPKIGKIPNFSPLCLAFRSNIARL